MPTILLLSLALAMDALAVALVKGSAPSARPGGALILGAVFGLAQGLMPLLGWALGITFEGAFKAVDHWIAFVLLTVLGVRMVIASRSVEVPATERGALTILTLMVAAFATSIDAAAAGITLPLLGVPIPLACAAIGLTTGLLCTGGYLVGARAGPRIGKHAELAGGIVLIGLGTKILIEHLGT